MPLILKRYGPLIFSCLLILKLKKNVKQKLFQTIILHIV